MKCNEKYNIVAQQMKELGFDIIRIPFYNQPVRNPANVAKFKNKETDKITILFGKYPHHLSKNNELSPQQKIQDALFLKIFLLHGENNPNKETYINILNIIYNLFILIKLEKKISNFIAEY